MITCENSHLLQDAYIHEDDYVFQDYEPHYYVVGSMHGKLLWEDMTVFAYTGPAPISPAKALYGWAYED